MADFLAEALVTPAIWAAMRRFKISCLVVAISILRTVTAFAADYDRGGHGEVALLATGAVGPLRLCRPVGAVQVRWGCAGPLRLCRAVGVSRGDCQRGSFGLPNGGGVRSDQAVIMAVAIRQASR